MKGLRQPKKPREIDRKSFQKWVEKDNFWFEEAAILPMTLEGAHRAMVSIHAWYEPGLNFAVFFYEKDYAYQVLSIPESIEHCKAQFSVLKEKTEKIDLNLKKWGIIVKMFEKELSRIDSIDFSKLSNAQLLDEFYRFNSELFKFWSITLTIEPYTPFIDLYYYPKFVKIAGDAKTAKEAFTVLTLPTKLSFIGEERRDMLKIAIKFLSGEEERKEILAKNIMEVLAEIKNNRPDFFIALQQHQQNYFWFQNSYMEWIVLSIKDFLGFLRDTIKTHSVEDLKKELEKLEDQESLSKKQKLFVKELKIPPETIKELKYIQSVTWLKDDRKRVILMMLHRMYLFVYEFSKRIKISPKLFAYALIYEIPKILGKSFPIAELKKRRKQCLCVAQINNRQSIIVGKDAVYFKKQVLEKRTSESKDQILGSVACRGPEAVVTGKAKVILNPKGETIKTDEILITSMTRPEFLPLMKIARAFVTNEGGITCHAAIVAREMNKPCIIGTENATRLFRTGDEIEMRMNHGTIKILKRA